MGLHQASDFDANLINAMVYGRSGDGKTHLAASVDKCFHILAERQGMMTIKSVNNNAAVWVLNESGQATPHQMHEELRKAYMYLKEHHQEFNAVAIDSLTEVYEMVLLESTIDNGREGMPEGVDYKFAQQATMNLVKKFRDLNLNTLYICLLDERQNEDKKVFYRPQLSPKLANLVRSTLNVCGVLVSKLNKDGDLERKVVFQPSAVYETKSAPGLDKVEPPDFDLWVRKINAAMSGKLPLKRESVPVEKTQEIKVEEQKPAKKESNGEAKRPPRRRRGAAQAEARS